MSDDNRAQKMYPRNPRYVLQLKDSKILRYAPYPRNNRSFYTEVINLSEGGLAFTVPHLECPKDSEIIMVEFKPPNSDAVACFAQVIRIQDHTHREANYEKVCKLVGVKFVNLKPEQIEMIRQGLNKEFKHLQTKFKRQQYLAHFYWLPLSPKNLFFAMATTVLLLLVLGMYFF